MLETDGVEVGVGAGVIEVVEVVGVLEVVDVLIILVRYLTKGRRLTKQLCVLKKLG